MPECPPPPPHAGGPDLPQHFLGAEHRLGGIMRGLVKGWVSSRAGCITGCHADGLHGQSAVGTGMFPFLQDPPCSHHHRLCIYLTLLSLGLLPGIYSSFDAVRKRRIKP
eukprot:1143430-Pelagomonas_calceolata.AAC.2